MAFNKLRLEYGLEGTPNFIFWKDCMEATLDDNGLLEYVKLYVAKPQASDAHNISQWKKCIQGEENNLGGNTRSYCLESPWKRKFVPDVERID